MLNFTGKTVLVTGAAAGIGYKTAEQMLQAGALVVMADNNAEALHKAGKELDPQGKNTLLIPVDIASAASVARMIKDIQETCGRLDHVVHCAGIYPKVLIAECSDETWKKAMNVNLDGTFYVCREAFTLLEEGGSIVLCASIAAHKGSYCHGAYAATKGGTLAFMHSIAMEYAPKVRVNCVSPGIIATSMTEELIDERGRALLEATPLKRFGEPGEVASVILFLCSPLASFVTGETIHINGGMFMD